MNFPENIKYTSDHEWIRIEGNQAFVGITDFAQKELGDIVFVEVETVGEDLGQGELFGTIEAVKTVSDLLLPVEAKVVEFNAALEDNPALINTDPYGEGWIIKVEVNAPADADSLMDAAAYKAQIGA